MTASGEGSMSREKDEITEDVIEFAKLSVRQRKRGYRFSLDAVLLSHFAVSENIGGNILEVGTGSGVVSMLIARSSRTLRRIVAVEIQESLVHMARINVEKNDLSEKVEVVHADIRDFAGELRGRFDAIVSNPPFGKIRAGRVNPDREKRIARHEYTLDVAALATVISSTLAPKGKFFLIYPGTRLLDAGFQLNRKKLRLEKVRLVHSFRMKDAEYALIKGGRGAQRETIFMPPLHIYDRPNSYSAEIVEMYRGMIRK